MWESLDKRKFPRINVKCDVLVKEQNSQDIINTETENIGVGGICVYLDKSLPVYSPVSIKLDLEYNGFAPIECVGKVVWCIKNKTLNQDKTRFDVGIEFQNIKPEDRDIIRKFIQTKIPA